MPIVILLSALLASLTGLVMGERVVARSQVAHSVPAPADAYAAARPGRAQTRPALRPDEAGIARRGADQPAMPRVESRLPRAYLRLKRALLE